MRGLGNYYIEDFENFKVQYDCYPKYISMTYHHFHDEYEVYYLINGERNYFVDNKVYPIRKGDLVLVKHNVIHRTTAVNNAKYERACFYFNDNFANSFSDNIRKLNIASLFDENVCLFRLDPSQQRIVESIISKMNNECWFEPDMYRAYVEMLMVELLIFIKRCKNTGQHSNLESNDPKTKKILEVVSYINTNYMEDLSLPLLSNRFYISISYLTRNFKLVTGFSFTEYLNSLRVKHSKLLLQETNLSISEISQKVGYANCTHFGRIFKTLSGYSALKYRKMYKSQDS